MNERRVLLIGSNILGNATVTRRISEAMGGLLDVSVTCVSIDQGDIDFCRIPRGVRRYQLLPTYLVLRKRLQELYRREPNFDLIFVITCQPLVALHGLWPDARVALWFDGLPYHSSPKFFARILNVLTRFVYRAPFGRIRHLLPMSEWASSRVSEFSFPKVRDVVISPARVSRSVWENRHPERASAGEVIRVLMVGNNAEGKGFIDFFHWCVRQKKDLSRFEFFVVSNERNRRLKDLVQGLPVLFFENISHDSLSELVGIYHSSHILLLPTKADMMPNVLIEAAASRLPIIASNIGAINEVVVDGRTGWLVESQRWDLFFERLKQFAYDPSYFSEKDIAENAERFFDEKLCADLSEIVFCK